MGTIIIGDPNTSRQVVTDAEADTLRYEVTLTGPGGTIDREVSGVLALTIQVVPGTWQVQVRAYDPVSGRLRAMNTTASFVVISGGSTHADIKMVTITEVTSWAELKAAAEGAIPAATPADREEIISLQGNTASGFTTGDGIAIQRKLTILAENNWTVTRSSGNDPFFTVSGSAELTISGTALTLDGASVTTTAPLVSVSGGTFVLDGATLKNNNRPGGNGGAVEVSSGSFTMKSGTISGNTADKGGGVYIGGGMFIKTGGTIYGSDVAAGLKDTASAGPNGHAVYYVPHPTYRDGTLWPGDNWDLTNPYLISDLVGLAAIAGNLAGHYTLANNITVTGTWAPIGGSTGFTGTLDGNGKTITFAPGSSLDWVMIGTEFYTGLFAGINGAVGVVAVKDLTITGTVTIPNCTGTAEVFAGSVTGALADAKLSNITSNLNLSANATGNTLLIGGIVGVSGGLISGSRYTGTITATGIGSTAVYAGGIVGELNSTAFSATISGSKHTGNIIATGGFVNVGGIAGFTMGFSVYMAVVEDCTHSGAITGTGTGSIDSCVGGIVGYHRNNSSTIGSYSEGTVAVTVTGTGDAHAGGIMGYNEGDASENCVALTSSVSATAGGTTYAQRIVGRTSWGTFTNNYALSTMSLSGGTVSAGIGTTDGGDFTNSGSSAWTALSPAGPGWTVAPAQAGANSTDPWWWNGTKPGLYWE
jgi:hypothetical protein